MSSNQASVADLSPASEAAAVAQDEAAEPIRIEMDKRVDVVVALCFAVFGAVALYYATGFRLDGYPDPVTARGLPYFTGTYLLVAGLVLVIRRLVTWQQIPGNYAVSEGKDDEPGVPSSALRVFSIVAVAAVWAYSLRSVGFLFATPVMLFGMCWLMNVRSPVKLIVFSIVGTLGVWVLFHVIIGVRLPMGVLAPLARSWGLLA